jgi:hypothetical protein
VDTSDYELPVQILSGRIAGLARGAWHFGVCCGGGSLSVSCLVYYTSLPGVVFGEGGNTSWMKSLRVSGSEGTVCGDEEVVFSSFGVGWESICRVCCWSVCSSRFIASGVDWDYSS